MKRLIAILIACVLCMGTAYAATWEDGRSPSKPYKNLPAVNLDKSMGYMMLYPKLDNAAAHYCDTLLIYLPREDLTIGEGTLRVMDAEGMIDSVEFSDADRVMLYLMTEEELQGMLWGGGMCIEIKLPVSLGIGDDSYITMDEGCFRTEDGKVLSPEIKQEDKWLPGFTDDYGIGRVWYGPAPAMAPNEDSDYGEEVAPTPIPAPSIRPLPVVETPKAGDAVYLDVVVGGNAVSASIYSDDGSVDFVNNVVMDRATVTGIIREDNWQWTVYFLDANGEIIEGLHFDPQSVEEEQ